MKITETIKATGKAILLAGITIFALSTQGQAQENEKFDPAKYQQTLMFEDLQLKDNIRKTINECKTRIARAKRVKNFIDNNPDLNENSKNVIHACEKRVVEVCGAIMAATKDIEKK